jgi:MoxR-like ATPase
VTIGGVKHPLAPPFFVLATQNPIEQEGTYPLPEAQLDRFMFMVRVDYPSAAEELDIVEMTTKPMAVQMEQILSGPEIMDLQEVVRRVPVPDHVLQYVLRLVRATRVGTADAAEFVKDRVAWGAGPRASQYLVLAAKARALLHGRLYVATEDVKAVAHPVLRHRIITTYGAEAEGYTSDRLIDDLLRSTPTSSASPAGEALRDQRSASVLGS